MVSKLPPHVTDGLLESFTALAFSRLCTQDDDGVVFVVTRRVFVHGGSLAIDGLDGRICQPFIAFMPLYSPARYFKGHGFAVVVVALMVDDRPILPLKRRPVEALAPVSSLTVSHNVHDTRGSRERVPCRDAHYPAN